MAGKGGVGGIGGGNVGAGQGGDSAGANSAGAGTGGDDHADPPQITAANPMPVCAESELGLTFSVNDGRPPYAWGFVGDDHGLVLVRNGGEAALSGSFAEPGDYPVTVRVTDADGDSDQESVTVQVRAKPVILTEQLPSVCQSENYSVPLRAEGGDQASYVWSSDLPSSTGLGVSDGQIEGRFVSSTTSAADVFFTLNLEHDGCAADPVELTLHAEAAGADVCPRIRVAGGAPTVPAACTGSPYSAQLEVAQSPSDRPEAYVWRTLSAPGDLAIDANTGALSGSTGLSGALDVEVENAAGRRIAATYTLTARDKCWLAYLAAEEGPSTKLHLFDALLGNRRTFGEASSAPVADFRFSPDGRYLAYRVGDSPDALGLALVELATLREEVTAFENVRQYAWSNDGSALAVAYGPAGSPLLGGVRVGVASSSSAWYEALLPVAAEVNSAPIWWGASSVAFLSSRGDPSPYTGVASLGEQGFSTPSVDFISFPPDTRLLPAPTGYFAVPSDGGVITFFASDGSFPASHDTVIVAPSGRYTAIATDGELRIFRASDDSLYFPDPPAYRTATGCDRLVAWAGSRERLACVRQGLARVELAFFDFSFESAQISQAIELREEDYLTDVDALKRLRRVFSPSGNRFAFATTEKLYVAKIVPTDSFVEFAYTLDMTNPSGDSVLAFSPDERMLVQHRGGQLDLWGTAGQSFLPRRLTNSLPLTEACRNEFFTPDGEYCGTQPSRAAFAWAPDASLLAFGTAAGVLHVADLRFPDAAGVLPAVTDDCGDRCVAFDRFAFQP